MSLQELTIRLYTDPILHKPCDLITQVDEDLIKLVANMFYIMKRNRGVGLAANQVGISKQLLVARLSVEGKPVECVLLNPKILKTSGKQDGSEGCLSAPGIFVPKRRSKELLVECETLHGSKVQFNATDLDARILQHEIDHLAGILCIKDLLPLTDLRDVQK
jgi:peptide deformylase